MKITIPAPQSNNKVTIFDTYIRLLMLLPITTLFQYHVPFINIALFIECLALISIIVYKHRRDIIYMLLPLFCGFMGSSRTQFVIIIAVFILGLYFFSTTKLRFSLMAIPAGIVGIVAFSVSAMSEKVKYTLDENQFGDFWYRISSSRSLI